jgi:hypothetical protein
MHDIDRTQLESEMDMFETDQSESVDQQEFSNNGQAESLFDEVEEMEIAAELLGMSDEAELDLFLGNLIKRAGRKFGAFVKTPVGRALGGILKGAVKQALPVLGGAFGGLTGGPVGAQLGSQLTSAAGRIFGLELEGFSPEDQEFEVAQRFVRFAGAAAKNAALAAPTTPPQAAARNAVIEAARRHAPGLLRGVGATPTVLATGARRSGRWIRRGNKIILFGV